MLLRRGKWCRQLHLGMSQPTSRGAGPALRDGDDDAGRRPSATPRFNGDMAGFGFRTDHSAAAKAAGNGGDALTSNGVSTYLAMPVSSITNSGRTYLASASSTIAIR